MNSDLERALQQCGTDLDGVRKRFGGDDALYEACLSAFLADTTMQQLSQAVTDREWDEAFTAAHALKGVAGNMGFVPLFHAAAELVVIIRTGKLGELPSAFSRVDERCKQIIHTIQNHCCNAASEHEGEHA